MAVNIVSKELPIKVPTVAKPFRTSYYRLRGLATGASRGLAETGESLELQETRMAVGGV
jgi:hypothetical protein